VVNFLNCLCDLNLRLWQVSKGAHNLVQKQGENSKASCGGDFEGYRLLGCDAIRCRLCEALGRRQ
jgi:hypothetical protein